MISFKAVRAGTLFFLLVGLSFTTTSAFAFWKEVTVTREVEIAQIGEPIEILITDLSDGNDGLYLVPKGYAIAVGDVERIELHYDIGVSRELLNQVILRITTDDILIGDDDTYSHLVKITVMGTEDGIDLELFNDTITITVIVELLEPIDMDEAIAKGLDIELVNVEDSVRAYEEIKGKTISFVMGFELVKKEAIE